MPRDRALVSGTLAAVVAASLFGMLGPLSRFGAEAGVDGVAFATWRATLGVTFLAILIVARRRGRASVAALRGLDGRGQVSLAIASLMGLALNAAIFSAFGLIPIALALMLFYTYPAGVVAVAAVLGRETITPSRLAALLLSTTGVVLVLAGGMGAGGGAPIDPVGILLGLGAASAQVVFITISRNGYRSAPADAAMLVILAVSMIGGALLAVAVGQGASLVAPLRSLAPWPSVLVAGVLAAGMASLLFLTAIRLHRRDAHRDPDAVRAGGRRHPRRAAAARVARARSSCSAARWSSPGRSCSRCGRRPIVPRWSRPEPGPSSSPGPGPPPTPRA